MDMSKVFEFLVSEEGPTSVEYAVLLAGILLACVSAITTVGGETANFWSSNQQALQDAYSGGP